MGAEQKILLIRHQEAAQKTQAGLVRLGYKSVLLAFSTIIPDSTPVPECDFDAMIITSPVGAGILQQHVLPENLSSLPVYCVGETTANLLQKTGFRVEHSPDAKRLADKLIRGEHGRKFLYPCAREHAFDFAAHFVHHELECCDWQIYENKLLTPGAREIQNAIENTNMIFFYSKRTTRHFFELLEDGTQSPLLSSHKIIAISQNVADVIPRKFRRNTYIASYKDEPSMIACLGDLDH